MKNIITLKNKYSLKKAEELRCFLLELDDICDILYSRLKYDGVWETLMKLEDVRIKYYTEFFEYSKIVELKDNNEK